ncbi:MAG: hypothetical protein ACO3DQ_07285, partial [Cephaloticoccus sp.]
SQQDQSNSSEASTPQQDQSSGNPQGGESESQDSGDEFEPKQSAGQKQGQSAFGDMDESAPPPEPSSQSGEMQQVGGAPEKKEGTAANTDPALAMPLQKLQKIRDQDSPATLFQMMEGKPEKPAGNAGKKW